MLTRMINRVREAVRRGWAWQKKQAWIQSSILMILICAVNAVIMALHHKPEAAIWAGCAAIAWWVVWMTEMRIQWRDETIQLYKLALREIETVLYPRDKREIKRGSNQIN